MAQPQRWGRIRDEDTIETYLDRHDTALTPGWITGTLFKAITEEIDALHRVNRERSARLEALETRLAEVERKTPVSFEGVHQPGKAYGAGSAVVRSGSLWIAKLATSATPGPEDVERHWQLAVKRGTV